MKPKSPFHAFAIGSALSTTLLAGGLEAAVIFTVRDNGPALNSSTAPSTTLGSISSAIGAAATAPQITYTLAGLDFTSVGGTASEQIQFTVGFAANAGVVVYNTLPNGNIFVNFNGAGTELANQIDSDETLTTTVALTSTTFSGGLSNLSIGFFSTLIGGYGTGDDVDVIFGATTVDKIFASDTDPTVNFGGNFSSFVIDTNGTKGVSGVNLQIYDIEITAVPEPTAALLGGLGLLALMHRRRA